MQVIDNSHVVCFDVDDTLIHWPWPGDNMPEGSTLITVGLNSYTTQVLANNTHIELLKRYKAKGKFIIVWSKSGHKWAEAVVKALGLIDRVNLVLSKPEKYVDDLDANQWMEHTFKGKINDKTPHN